MFFGVLFLQSYFSLFSLILCVFQPPPKGKEEEEEEGDHTKHSEEVEEKEEAT